MQVWSHKRCCGQWKTGKLLNIYFWEDLPLGRSLENSGNTYSEAVYRAEWTGRIKAAMSKLSTDSLISRICAPVWLWGEWYVFYKLDRRITQIEFFLTRVALTQCGSTANEKRHIHPLGMGNSPELEQNFSHQQNLISFTNRTLPNTWFQCLTGPK